jgi:hypothetical protein
MAKTFFPCLDIGILSFSVPLFAKAGFGLLYDKAEDWAVKSTAQRAGSDCASAWLRTFGLASLGPGIRMKRSSFIRQCAWWGGNRSGSSGR